jgi:MFS family permease
MLLGGLGFMAGSALLASAYSWPQLVAGRLVMGLGVGLATQATPLYLMEMSPPQWRGECVCVCVCGGGGVGVGGGWGGGAGHTGNTYVPHGDVTTTVEGEVGGGAK